MAASRWLDAAASGVCCVCSRQRSALNPQTDPESPSGVLGTMVISSASKNPALERYFQLRSCSMDPFRGDNVVKGPGIGFERSFCHWIDLVSV